MYDHMKHFKSLSLEELEKFKEQARDSIVSSGAQTIAEKLLVIYNEAIKEYSLKQMYKKSPRSVKKAYKAQYGDPAFTKKASRPKRKVSVKAKRVTEEEKLQRRKAQKAAIARYNAAKEIRRQHKKRNTNKNK